MQIPNRYLTKRETPLSVLRSGVFWPSFALPCNKLKPIFWNFIFFHIFDLSCQGNYKYNTFTGNDRSDRPITSVYNFENKFLPTFSISSFECKSDGLAMLVFKFVFTAHLSRLKRGSLRSSETRRTQRIIIFPLPLTPLNTGQGRR